MLNLDLLAIVLYFIVVIGIGVYFFVKSKNEQGEKEHFKCGSCVTANGNNRRYGIGTESDHSIFVRIGI